MKPFAVLAAAILLLPAAAAGAASPESLTLPGHLVDSVRLRAGQGRETMALLVETEKDQRRLLRITTEGTPRLESFGPEAAGDVRRLGALDRDGDGVDEILLYYADRIEWLAPLGGDDTSSALLPSGQGAPAPGVRGIAGRSPAGAAWFALPEMGSVRLYAPGGDGGAADAAASPWLLLAEPTIPITVRQKDEGLELRSLPIRGIAAPGEPPSLLAAGPEAVGIDRLRTLLIDPAAPEAARRREVWSRLPGPERVMESHYLLVAGRPALLVTTRSALKLSFFEEKLLRLFFLDEPDRSQAGSVPALAAESGMNLWQPAATAAPTWWSATGAGSRTRGWSWRPGSRARKEASSTRLAPPNSMWRGPPGPSWDMAPI